MRLFGLGLLLLSLLACQEKNPAPQPLKAYYFPLDSLDEGMVYEYRAIEGQFPPQYWYMNRVANEQGDRYLITTIYDFNYEQRLITREFIASNGTVIEGYRIFYTDENSKVQSEEAKIQEGVFFGWDPPRSAEEAYRFRMSYDIPSGDTLMTYNFTRDRFFDQFVTRKWKGEEIEVAQFKNLQYFHLDGNDGGEWNIDSIRLTEHYAKGIGLVYYKKEMPQQPAEVYELHDRYPMSTFEEKARLATQVADTVGTQLQTKSE